MLESTGTFYLKIWTCCLKRLQRFLHRLQCARKHRVSLSVWIRLFNHRIYARKNRTIHCPSCGEVKHATPGTQHRQKANGIKLSYKKFTSGLAIAQQLKKTFHSPQGWLCTPWLIISTTFLSAVATNKFFGQLTIDSFSFLSPGFAALLWCLSETNG